MWHLLRNRAVSLGVRNVRFSSGLSQEQILKTQTLMKRVSIFIVPIVVGMTALNAYNLEEEHHNHGRPEYVSYPYLNIRTKGLPWGDGQHSFFHNPKMNYVPDIGYEEDW